MLQFVSRHGPRRAGSNVHGQCLRAHRFFQLHEKDPHFHCQFYQPCHSARHHPKKHDVSQESSSNCRCPSHCSYSPFFFPFPEPLSRCFGSPRCLWVSSPLILNLIHIIILILRAVIFFVFAVSREASPSSHLPHHSDFMLFMSHVSTCINSSPSLQSSSASIPIFKPLQFPFFLDPQEPL